MSNYSLCWLGCSYHTFGPCLIEGNPYPGYYYQFPIYLPDKIGFMPKVKDILNELNLDI